MKDVLAIGAALIDIVALIDNFPGIDEEVFVPKLEIMGGGSAANVAIACARLNLKTGFIGKLGKDEFGKRLLQEFQKEGIDINGIVYSTDVPTGNCYAVVDKVGNRILYAFSGAANLLDPGEIQEEYLKSFQIIHLASLKNISPLMKAAEYVQNHSTRVCLNPGALIVEQGLEVVKPLLKLTNIFIASQGEIKQLFKTDNLKYALENLLEFVEIIAVTRGAEGSLIATADLRFEITAEKVKVVDTTGAGDAFSAGFIFGLLKYQFDHHKLKLCGMMGNLSAAHCIQQVGARNGLITQDKLLKRVK